MSQFPKHTHKDAGFTIVELMIAVALVGFVVLATFVFFNVSSRALQQQADSLRSYERIGFALEVLRADLNMAAYLGTPNASLDIDDYGNEFIMCHNPVLDGTVAATASRTLGAIAFKDGGSPATNLSGDWSDLSPSGEMPMELELLGAFRVPELLHVRAAAGSMLNVEPPTEVLRTPEIGGQSRQLDLYKQLTEGSIVAIINRFGGVVMAEVGGTPSLVGELQLRQVPSPVPGRGEQCNFGVGGEIADDNTRVSLLHRVRYRIEPMPEAGPDDGELIVRPALVRSVLGTSSSGGEPVEIERAILARNIIDLQFGVARDSSEPTSPPSIPNTPFGAGNAGLSSGQLGELNRADTISKTLTCPHRTRQVYVQMSVRLDTALEQIPQLPGEVVRSTIEIDGERARVVTFRTEVPLMNFVLADLTGPPC